MLFGFLLQEFVIHYLSVFVKLKSLPTFRRYLKTFYFQSAHPFSAHLAENILVRTPCTLIFLRPWHYRNLLTYWSKIADCNLPHLYFALCLGDPDGISPRSLASEN